MTPSSAREPRPETDAETEARERVAEIKTFYSHLASFLIVNTMLVGIWLATGSSHFWPIYPILGWGMGLASHASAIFGFFGMFDRSWEERKVRELILQKEHGLSADQVRTLLKKEMAAERTLMPSAGELRRIDQRLQNLEAIVTSRDWDELPTHADVLRPELEAEKDEPDVDAARDAARLARKVR